MTMPPGMYCCVIAALYILSDFEREISFVINGRLDLLVSLSTPSFWTSSKDNFISELKLLMVIAVEVSTRSRANGELSFICCSMPIGWAGQIKAFKCFVLCPREDVLKTTIPQILLNLCDTQLSLILQIRGFLPIADIENHLPLSLPEDSYQKQ